HLPVVFRDLDRIEVAVREQREELRDARLGQVNRRGLQGLEEAGREAEGHAVAAPGFEAPAGREREVARLGERLAFEVIEQRRGSLVRVDLGARIHVPVAAAVLQGYAP